MTTDNYFYTINFFSNVSIQLNGIDKFSDKFIYAYLYKLYLFSCYKKNLANYNLYEYIQNF